MAAFAEGTEVPVAKTRGEIEALVMKHGAQNFGSGWIKDLRAGISFGLRGRLLRFELELPSTDEARTALRKRRGGWGHRTTPADITKWTDQEARRRWRCLLLIIKGKLEAVQSGIHTFDQEFLSHIVTDNNLTIYERLKNARTTAGVPLLPPVDG